MEHNHLHNHEHCHNHASEKRLWISIFLNLIITIAQVIGGVISNSLALISDSFHNLTDTFSMGLSLFASRVSQKECNSNKTFGYKRAEIIAAFINTSLLIAVSFFLFKEAFERITKPQIIDGKIMLIVAIIGLFGNLFSAALLFKDSQNSLNIKSAFLHIFTDTLSSFAVIIGGILIIYKGFVIIDPILTFAIGLYVLIISYKIFKSTIHILMQGVPDNISVDEIKECIEEQDEVNNIHHVHIWSLTGNDIFFECHICVNKIDMTEVEEIKLKIKNMLKEKFDISHSTLEFELEGCEDKLIEK